jgi:hypothetical protein
LLCREWWRQISSFFVDFSNRKNGIGNQAGSMVLNEAGQITKAVLNTNENLEDLRNVFQESVRRALPG